MEIEIAITRSIYDMPFHYPRNARHMGLTESMVMNGHTQGKNKGTLHRHMQTSLQNKL